MDSRQIAEWLAYSLVEPFGSRHEELLHGIRCVAALLPYRKAGHDIVPEEFMPSYERPEQSWQEMRDNLLLWKAAAGGEE